MMLRAPCDAFRADKVAVSRKLQLRGNNNSRGRFRVAFEVFDLGRTALGVLDFGRVALDTLGFGSGAFSVSDCGSETFDVRDCGIIDVDEEVFFSNHR